MEKVIIKKVKIIKCKVEKRLKRERNVTPKDKKRNKKHIQKSEKKKTKKVEKRRMEKVKNRKTVNRENS